MAGFFSLGGTQNKEEEEVEKGDKNNLLLLRNEEIYNNKGGFEIWPQSSSSYHLSNYFAFGVGPSRRNRSEDVSLCVSEDESTRFGLSVMRTGGTLSCCTSVRTFRTLIVEKSLENMSSDVDRGLIRTLFI